MTNINIVSANTFKSTKESRAKLISILSNEERKMFINFVKSIENTK